MNRHTARAEAEIASLESEFRMKLVTALRDCANGRWGLFGQNEHLLDDRSLDSEELLEIGASIEELRRKAGMPERFELYRSFKSKRGRQGANALGEPRLAEKLLEELGE
jgi:proline dehydrogenase